MRQSRTIPRLYVSDALISGAQVTLSAEQSHYLATVLRSSVGATVELFNGREGEWVCAITEIKKKAVTVELTSQQRPQVLPADIDVAFAPLKHARLDFMAQKFAELGVKTVAPVITDRTIAAKLNMDRLRANLIEGAEQCGVLWVPETHQPQKLNGFLDQHDGNRALVFCDEGAETANPLPVLEQVKGRPCTVLLGPEGGFTPEERQRIYARANAVALSLGPRIMRADTAAVAALTLVQATIGDWHA